MATAQLGTVYIGEACEVIVNYGNLVNTHTLDFKVSMIGEPETHTWKPNSSELVLKSKNETTAVYAWTPPASLAQYIPNRPSAGCVFTVKETRYNSTGQPFPTSSNSTAFTAYIPQSLSPIVEIVLTPESDSAKITEWGIFVKGMSRVRYEVKASGQHGASVTSQTFSVGGHTSKEATGTTPLLITAGLPTAVVTDSRGKTTRKQETIDIYDYSAPTLRDTVEYRCDSDGTPNESGAYLRVQCSAVCSTLGGRNTVSVRARYRKVGEPWGDGYYTLQDGVEEQIALALDTEAVYEVELSAVDDVGSVTAISFIGDNGRIAMHMRDGGDGVAFGKKCTDAGFSCAWDASFDGNVDVAGALTIGGKPIVDIVYPVGAVYISVNETSPATLFGGTWARIKDRFLLAAGDTYAAGRMDGSASHKITVEEMPAHTHKVTGSTDATDVGHDHGIPNIKSGQSGEYGAYAESWGYGSGNRDLNANYIALPHIHYLDGTATSTGGGNAMSIMPPYLSVYMWQRTA